MKTRYRLFQRNSGIYFIQDNETDKQESLKTRDKAEALRIFNARNEAQQQPAINRAIAKVYLTVSDPVSLTRDWEYVMRAVADTKRGNTRARWERAMREKPFDAIRNLKLIDTQADHFLKVLKTGTVSTNIFLRRLHNFTMDMDWIPKAVIPRRQWPRIDFDEKRAITAEEHRRIITGERNAEWRAFYRLLWHIGGSQTDIANLCAEDVDWDCKVIRFHRMKTQTLVKIRFGKDVESILSDLPGTGYLMPNIARKHEKDRAKQFMRRCRLVGVKCALNVTDDDRKRGERGVSLHSYRYAWAERARSVGYPERAAQEALGHTSKAVHRAYAKGAEVTVAPLEAYEAAREEYTGGDRRS